MALRVRIRGLDKLEAMRRHLLSDFLSKGSEVGAEEVLNLISDGFRKGLDPYGNAWDAPNELQITGAIKKYTKVRSDRRGWKVASTDQKAIWHHDPQPREAWGGKSLPIRLQVPTKAQGWPANWKKKVSLAVKEGIVAALQGR